MSFKAVETQIDEAMQQYSQMLEQMAIADLMVLAQRNPELTCLFVSGMGTWGWELGDDDVDKMPPDLKAQEQWDYAFDKYGYSVIPTVRAEIKNGNLEVLHNW